MNTNSQILSIFRMTALIFSECFCIIKILLCRAANTKVIAWKSSRYTLPHILSHSTAKDSAFRLILSSQSFQSQASENSPTASRDLGKRNGSTSNVLFGKCSFPAGLFYNLFLMLYNFSNIDLHCIFGFYQAWAGGESFPPPSQK